ncbi:MAG TPA: DNA polymerase III subunit gamma/tau [Candidatus Saccharicenans sp.]|nr:DNA polymerase III subunit gamma/tau [Candidatus Saccharicenans sp.]HQM74621.1 DNA polymerase III subunit gamma/tau [Candidatus Saccharicenans sp.]
MSDQHLDNPNDSYLVLARKYRPRKFSEVVGQEAVVRTLQNAIRENRISHAYLFSGMRGVGKTTVARILAKALNCQFGPAPEPCNQCELCQAINEDRLVDFIEIDGASNRGIEDVKALRESIQYEPMHSRYRIIIIDEVHQLSRDAFNALLKTLEEPPTRTIFIFATTEFHKVPRTIISRCQHFVFKRLTTEVIASHLRFIAEQEGLTISPYSLKLIAEAADGSLRDAETLLDQVISFSGLQVKDQDTEEILGVIDHRLFEKFSRAIITGQDEQIFGLVEELVSAGYDLRYFYNGLIEHFRQLLLARIVKDPAALNWLSEEELNHLRDISQSLLPEEILRYLTVLQEGESGLRYSAQPRIFLEAHLIRLCYLSRLKPLDQVLEEVKELKLQLKKGLPKSEPRKPDYQTPAPRPAEKSRGAVRSPDFQRADNQTRVAGNGVPVLGHPVADEFYFRLMKDRPALAPILKVASKVEVRDKCMQFIFSQDKKHFAVLIEQNEAYLNRLAADFDGYRFEVKVEEDSREEKRAQPNLAGSGQKKIGQVGNGEGRAVIEDPKVKNILDDLRGQVISVKKKNNNNKS